MSDKCPKCGSTKIISYKEFETYEDRLECQVCKYDWVDPHQEEDEPGYSYEPTPGELEREDVEIEQCAGGRLSGFYS